MPEQKSTLKKRWEILIFIIIISVIGFIILIFKTSYNQKQAFVIKITNEKLLVKKKTNEIEKLRQQLKNITEVNAANNANNLLKRDIKLYIKTTHPKVASVVAKEIADKIVDLSKKYKVSPELILGIIKVESAFNPMAVGSKTKYGHARGLMQVMPEWVKKLGLENQYDFHEINIAIESGIRVFLIHLNEGKGDISTGLYYYVNQDKKYIGKVYEAMGKFVAFRSTINEETLNVETDIDKNGDSKKLPETQKEGNK